MQESMKDYRDFAVDLAKQAGAIMRRNFALGMKREWKGDDTPLTATDTAVNDLVLEAIHKQFPEHGVLSEEGSTVTGKEEYIWVCDSVDGTIPFSHGVPVCTFLIALVRNGVSVLGVAYDPFMDRLYVAERGAGATVNGEPLHVSKTTSLNNALLAVEGRNLYTKTNMIAVLEQLEKQGALIMRPFSFGYQSTLVAAGQMVAVIFPPGSGFAWDVAAVSVIVEEAGGRFSDLYGEQPRYDRDMRGFVVSNGQVHDQLLAVLKPLLTK